MSAEMMKSIPTSRKRKCRQIVDQAVREAAESDQPPLLEKMRKWAFVPHREHAREFDGCRCLEN
jgi:hypothetical protein